jgi:G3E family GTPase
MSLLADFSGHDLLSARGETRGADDRRTLADLLVEQIEFADVIVVNKVSDVPPATRAELRRVLAALNADARVVEVDHGRVPLRAVLQTGLFDEAKAASHPLWHKELHDPRSHVPETEEYGITSFVYRARRPFHPQRFHDFLSGGWKGLIRAKGYFWLATRPDWVGLLSIAGAQCRSDPKGLWWAAVPREKWPRHAQFLHFLRRNWSPRWGDRRQELVFIGTGIEGRLIGAALDACLVAEDDPRAWAALRDPFPPWRQLAA